MTDTVPPIILQHGFKGPARWFGWLQKRCLGQGCEMRAPLMSSPARPSRKSWLKQMCVGYGTIDGAIIVAHSLGCYALVHYLGSCAQGKARAVILVAPPAFYTGKAYTKCFYSKEPNWSEAKKHAKRFVVIHSKDDIIVPVEHTEEYVKRLGAKRRLVNGKGHFLQSENELVWWYIRYFIQHP